MEDGGPGLPGPPFTLGWEGWRRTSCAIPGACGSLVPTVFSSAPREHSVAKATRRRTEWNLAEIEAYHGGTSRAGRDEWRDDSGLVALDGWSQFEYDSRLSRKRDSEQEIELFDNREWNQNVRGELEVVRGLQGP